MMLQSEALDLLKTGKNIFLTGAAGAGKTYLLNRYIQYLREHQVAVAVTASTGIAATHIGGTTIHAWSGIGIKERLEAHDLKKIQDNKRIRNHYKNNRVLIIDEVSMLHKNNLDMLDTLARYILNSDKPFGGLQLVLCGDFFQLPPICHASTGLEKPFAFYASVWNEEIFQICYLQEQHRQQNDPLLDVLNDIRSGTAGEQTKVPLRTRYKKEPEGATRATRLYSRNMNVDAINDAELAKLAGRAQTYKMTDQGIEVLVEGLKKSCLASANLELKVGAQVMFVKNDNQYGRFVNGTRAAVIDFEDSADAWPIVKTYDNRLLTVTPEAWNFEDDQMVLASIQQVPLRLAWAITIHKSQGMTLDAAEMDLGDAFEPGMGYVALSRVRKLTGLKLMNLNEMALRVHPHVLEQDLLFKANSRLGIEFLNGLSEEALASVQRQALLERFEGHPQAKTINELKLSRPKKAARKKKEKDIKPPSHLVSYELLKENLCIKTTAAARSLNTNTILTHIEKLKAAGIIDSTFLKSLKRPIKTSLSEADYQLLCAELKNSSDGKIKTIYDKYEKKYSFADIQMVRVFELA